MKKGLETSGWILFMTGIGVWMIQAIIAGEIIGIFTAISWFAGCCLIIIGQMIKS
ncbi:MAG: hypothetical protein VX643_02505 [Chloroflexota bacterium]|nr:hypothetical protein [Chloroflexota bacterium]|tara:strand:- start:1668 stop:1832 length:165 start_codon:yes stop_codon:yes gene_type:complete